MTYRHGKHTWREHWSDDPEAAQAWYTNILQWGHESQDMGEFVYNMFSIGGLVQGGFCQLTEEQKQMGAPPHWLTYVSIADVNGAVARARDNGGQVLAEPFAVPTVGTIAVIMDPQGGVLALFHAEDGDPEVHAPPPPHGDYWWAELMAKDDTAALEFYTRVLGWSTQSMPMPVGTYHVFMNSETDASSGCMKLPAEVGDVPAHWSVYFAVDDCDAAVATAKETGANVLAGPMEAQGVGRFATIQDPYGAVVGLITPALDGQQ